MIVHFDGASLKMLTVTGPAQRQIAAVDYQSIAVAGAPMNICHADSTLLLPMQSTGGTVVSAQYAVSIVIYFDIGCIMFRGRKSVDIVNKS